MKKTKILLIALLLTIQATLTQAQLVHNKGTKAFGAGVGIIDKGNQLNVQMQWYTSRNTFWQTQVYYDQATLNLSTHKLYVAQAQYNYSMIKFLNRCYLNVQVGLGFGYENIQSNVMNEEKNGAVITETGGILLESHITKKIKLDVSANQRFYQFSNAGFASWNYQFCLFYII